VSAATSRGLFIAQLGTIDEGGGAATIAGGLMRGYTARGHRVRYVVGRKCSSDPNITVLPDDDRSAYRLSGYAAAQTALRRLAGQYPDRGFGAVSRTLRLATHPNAVKSRLLGLEDFDFPGAHRLLDGLEALPDIMQGHNLHGGYFDLRALESISARVPTVLTMHDMWLLTGHCAHSLGCDRWKTGCGHCPDLHLDPAVRRDATAENWRRKQEVYARSRLHIVTPSQWLLDKVEQSMLGPLVRKARVIPNGIDTTIFRPGNKQAVRTALGLPSDHFIMLVTTGTRGSMWKDDKTLREAMRRIAGQALGRPTLFIAVGRDSAVASHDRIATRSIPFQRDPLVMAQYYQAVDLYMHAARADTFPTAVLEALACGTPVVATGVSGIPEQIVSASLDAIQSGHIESLGDATGIVVPPGGGAEMADAVVRLLANDAVRGRLGANALRDVERRFTLDRQVDAYLAWYCTIIGEQADSSRKPTCAVLP
jgi:glycosyltransferase involved in cell wall biosynthesis